ncbi:UDP-N-acetylmuramoyl-L-alanine--D-glutamate ligase [Protaetiibacter mangrovi]|uniref:UDP-N-acetylmuramoylalanine--D-glutamate ligase n=1 Tax=Protaetiibacter mangrovi TaxID=2970926 RepID=A0ABT1ZB58_9MICO|nr:UDP-N-acetylmuramoyl-L-alanine--D-glutamate ligase [Protaetiibacter mangrovi]MCS0497948.1 UDP-N-acetylmuramoyl-L-alanine--D-glutamate ligase [Protaetiibacter mangrovi]TPX02104.1 UDP-N-acetylmuramoyl-L-alanine--D-glutamate ligase [Schumannella luteola]
MADPLSAHLEELTSWRADWSGLRVAVLGLGVTGFAVADTLQELGAETLVVAARGSDEHRQLLNVIGSRFLEHSDDAGVPEELLAFGPQLLVVSPGYHPDHPLLLWAEQAGIPIWGDIELAWRLRDKVVRTDGTPADWILVTGTNGKTTTTQLTAHMLVAGGLRAAPAGNIGIPVLDAVRDPAGFDVLVVELSSYQLHWSHRNDGGGLAPLASVCLNIADDHLDWHGSREGYVAAKGRVYENTRVACVYNIADEATMHLVEDAEVQEGCRAIGFGLGVPGRSDLGVIEGILVDRAFLEERHSHALELTTLDELHEAGLGAPHSVQNVLAASALARAAGVEPARIREALRSFRMDAHRTEVVATASGVVWIDDSKATNAHAADASLRASSSVVWIAGGLLKGVDPAPLVERHAGRLRAAVLIGVDRDALRSAFERHAPGVPVLEVDGSETEGVMSAAVRAAASVAEPGDVVLLAPAAASMDQFTDYADRGRRFAEAVREHLGGGADDDDQAAGPSASGSDPA